MHTSPFAPDRFSPLLHFSDEKKKPNIEMILLQTLLLFPIIILISSRGVKSTKYAGYSKVTLAVLSRQVSIMSSSKSFGFINLPFFSARVKFLPNYRSRTLEAERRPQKTKAQIAPRLTKASKRVHNNSSSKGFLFSFCLRYMYHLGIIKMNGF